MAQKGWSLHSSYCKSDNVFSGKDGTFKTFGPSASEIISSQWAKLLQTGVQDQQSYDDTFIIEKVVTSVISYLVWP